MTHFPFQIPGSLGHGLHLCKWVRKGDSAHTGLGSSACSGPYLCEWNEALIICNPPSTSLSIFFLNGLFVFLFEDTLTIGYEDIWFFLTFYSFPILYYIFLIHFDLVHFNNFHFRSSTYLLNVRLDNSVHVNCIYSVHTHPSTLSYLPPSLTSPFFPQSPHPTSVCLDFALWCVKVNHGHPHGKIWNTPGIWLTGRWLSWGNDFLPSSSAHLLFAGWVGQSPWDSPWLDTQWLHLVQALCRQVWLLQLHGCRHLVVFWPCVLISWGNRLCFTHCSSCRPLFFLSFLPPSLPSYFTSSLFPLSLSF